MYFQGTPVGNMPPQAAINGLGMPPQAQAGLIGMMPPQAAAGMGRAAETTPQTVSSAMPGGDPRAWRDGVFGARYAQAKDRNPLRPWRDGVFGPALGESNGNGNGNVLTLTPSVITEIQRALNLLVDVYKVPQPAGTWDDATLAAYHMFAANQTPGFEPKSALYKEKNGREYPSAAGIWVLMTSARQAWQETAASPEEGDQKWRDMYPQLVTFAETYGETETGSVSVPNGNGEPRATQASTLLLWGGGAALLAGAVYALSKKKKRR